MDPKVAEPPTWHPKVHRLGKVGVAGSTKLTVYGTAPMVAFINPSNHERLTYLLFFQCILFTFNFQGVFPPSFPIPRSNRHRNVASPPGNRNPRPNPNLNSI